MAAEGRDSAPFPQHAFAHSQDTTLALQSWLACSEAELRPPSVCAHQASQVTPCPAMCVRSYRRNSSGSTRTLPRSGGRLRRRACGQQKGKCR